MPGIDRDRRKDRKDLVVEALVEFGESLGGEIVGLDEHDARFGKPGEEAGKALRLHAHQFVNAFSDSRELLADGHPVRSNLVHLARDLLLEPGHANHEELVEIARHDRVELQPLEQRHGLVVGLGQDSSIELEPRELAIEIECARTKIRWRVRSARCSGPTHRGRRARVRRGRGGINNRKGILHGHRPELRTP